MDTQRSARINLRLVVLLGVLFSVGATGVVLVHQIRKRATAREALAAGQAAFEAGRWEEAASNLKRYLSKYPDDETVLMQYAEAQMAIRPPRPETIASAITAYRRLLRYHPGDRDLCERLAKLYFATGDFVNTRYVAQQRLQQDPNDVRAITWVGKSLLAQQKHDDVRDALTLFVEERDVAAVPAYVLLSQAALLSGSGGAEEALEYLNRAVRNSPDSAEALAHRAKLYLDPRTRVHDRLERAREDLEAANRLAPDRLEDRLLLAEGWLALNELDRAQVELTAAASLPLAPDAHFDFEREEARLMILRVASRLALLRGDRSEALALAEQGANELTQVRRTQFLPIATQLYLLAGNVEEARKCLTAYHEQVDEAAREDKQLAEQLALLDAQLATAENRPFDALAHLEGVVSVSDAQDPVVWRELGAAYIRTNQDRRAIGALERYLSVQRDDFPAMLMLANTYYRRADWPNVLKWAQLALERRPDDFEARIIQIEAVLKGGRGGKPSASEIAHLSSDLETLQQTHPGSTEVRILKSLIRYQQEGAVAAEEELRKAASETDKPALALLQLVEVLRIQGKQDEALAACRSAIEKDPESAAPRVTLAQLHFAAGDLAAAEEALRQAGSELKGDERARSQLTFAAHLLANDRREEGIRILRELAGQRPSDIEPRLRLLDVPEIQQDREAAQALVDEVQKIEGRERGLRWRYEQARVLMRDENWKQRREEVIQLLTRVVENDRSWTAAVLLLGGAYEALNQDQQAEEVYRRFVESYPDNILVVSRYLELLERQGRFAQASQVLDRLPDLPVLSAHKTTVALGQRRYNEAIAELKKQKERNPRDAAANVLLARLTYHQVRHQSAERRAEGLAEAMKLLDEARQLAPDLLSVTSTRVMLLSAEGRKEEALRVLDEEVARRNDFSAYLLRAEFYAAERRFEEAEKDYRHLTTFPTGVEEGYLRLANFYLQTGRSDEAAAACDAGLKHNSSNIELKKMLVRARLASPSEETRRRGQALLEELLAADPQDPSLLTIQAEAYLAENTPAAREKAIALFEQVVQAEPRSIAAHLQLIRHASARGDLARASQLAARAIGANPDNADLLLVRASIESDLQNYVTARELANFVLERDPHNVAALNLLTELALQLNDIEEAEQHNAVVLRLMSEHEDAQLSAARIAEARGDIAGAIRLLEAYRQAPPGRGSHKCALKLADLYRMQKDYARCEEQLDQLEAAGYDAINVLVVRFQALAEQQKFDAFVQRLEKELASRPHESRALLSAATILSQVDAVAQLERIKPLVARCLQENPADTTAYLAMAILAYRTLDMKGAQQAYMQILKLDPYHLKALNNLAWILSEEMGQYEEALAYANTGVLRYPADPNLLNTRGVILFRQNKLVEAKLDLHKCIELPNTLSGTRARSLAFLGRIALREGNPQEARHYLTQAMELDQQVRVLTAEERADIESLLGTPATRAAVD